MKLRFVDLLWHPALRGRSAVSFRGGRRRDKREPGEAGAVHGEGNERRNEAE